MLQIVKKLLYVIPASNLAMVRIVLLFIFSSGLEIFGIGAIAPFINLAGNPALIHQSSLLERLYIFSGSIDENRFIAYLGLLAMLLFCTKVLVAWLTQSYIFVFSCRQQKRLINRLLDRYLSAPYTYHLENGSSYVVDNVIDVANSFNFIVQPLFVVASNLLVAISLFLLLWYTNSTVMLILLVVLLPIIFLIYSFKQKIREWGAQTRQSKGELIKTINHSLGGIKETKVIGCEQYFKQQILQQTKELETSQTSFFSFNTVPRYTIEAAMVVSTIGVICYFLFAGSDIDRLHGVLGVYALASIRFMPAFSQATSGINTLRNSSYAIDRLYFDLKGWQQDILHQKVRAQIPVEPRKKLSFQEGLELSHISYQYPNQDSRAIENLSLSIKKGESIAFIGKSGAGKTTLVDIILGLLVASEGDIKVDGKSAYSDLRAWQNLIGYIPQSIFLADDTIERNIAFGVPDELVDRQRLYQAIETAQLTEVIDNLPNGIDTKVGERGILLSGGQRQRIGIARALYHEREILVLDEATAALDNETEKLVVDAINSLSGKKTLITIAHRLSTVEKCDRIYRLDRGKISDFGSYSTVVLGQ